MSDTDESIMTIDPEKQDRFVDTITKLFAPLHSGTDTRPVESYTEGHHQLQVAQAEDRR